MKIYKFHISFAMLLSAFSLLDSPILAKNNILLSLIVPCYNRARTLPKTIESIYTQTTNFEFEVICIDDASTDTTYSVLHKYSKKYPHFRIYTHNKNLGASEARNTGIHHAQGSLIFTLDSDNLLAKNTLQPLVDLLLTSKCDAASVGAVYYIDEDDQFIRFTSYKQTDGYFDLRHIFLGTPSPASSGNYLFTKESFYRAGGYQDKGLETWNLAFRQLITGTRIAILPNTYYIHRISNDSNWIDQESKGLNDSVSAKLVLNYSAILTDESQEYIQKYKKNTKGFFKDMRHGHFKVKPLEEIERLLQTYVNQLQITPPADSQHPYVDIAAMGQEQYQDIIINNEIVQEATGPRRDCAGRYEIIKKVLELYKRPFTLIDLGASQGYYSFRTAHDYNAVCVMIDDNNWYYPYVGDQLLSLCDANNLDNIILLKKVLNVEDVTKLGTCEHFDVILAMNIIHWFGNQWKEIADALLNLGDNIIVETPPEEEHLSIAQNKLRRKINNYLMDNGGQQIGTVKRHTSNAHSIIYWIHKPKETLKYSSWLDKRFIKNHQIKSSFTEKHLIDSKSQEKTVWVPGINLVTFKMYHGAYPHTSDIIPLLETIVDPEHKDWMPNNMIIQGKKNLVLIDKDPPGSPLSGGYYPFSPDSKNLITQWLSLHEYEKLYDYFWDVLEVNLKGDQSQLHTASKK